ncbi:hypothetical protein LRLP16767_LR202_00293 [Limosilactobacillus reuteri]|uniref:Uncharacterized protein n=1 Tax=Limosilactobacillus reuteri TaxID=1598 RepID=A0A0U5F757_LIMRT|nr:hypothetical protein [Limosilactobacillus reuteri]CUR40236.1 hypothetical protein LRLP16767_LR202_00293 [Limosilactobacillus reuteri]
MAELPKHDYELAEQEDFYKQYLPLVNSELDPVDVQVHSTDGLIGDLLLEFKPSIKDLNAVLFQAIKYLSHFRLNGQAVPSNILLISYDEGTAYYYKADNYLPDIEKVYTRAASKDVTGQFVTGDPKAVWHYGDNSVDEDAMIQLMKGAYKRNQNGNQQWVAVHIDSDDIIGWATTYYKENKGARKAEFLGDSTIIGEIRQPRKLKGRILPYTGKDNAAFQYIMDKLNDYVERADLGAFYTPMPYATKSNELVYDAIRRFQQSGNDDYIILDRCAGTGNLEATLNDNVPNDIVDKDVLSHVIVNTYEFFEYKVLKQRLGDQVRNIIPPVANFTDGTVEGSNALSQEFVENPIIKQYVDNPKCTVIIYENPPFAETTSIEHQKRHSGKSSSKKWKYNYVTMQSKQELKGARSNDMSNVFIWSAFHYYLRQSTDSAIIFSPLKYWKLGQDWFDFKAGKALAFNRKYFHAVRQMVNGCVLWLNELAKPTDNGGDSLKLVAYDIIDAAAPNYDTGELTVIDENVVAKRIHSNFSQSYYAETTEPDDVVQQKERPYPLHPDAIWSAFNGREGRDKRLSVNAKYNNDIIGYLTAQASTFENDSSMTHLLRNTQYNGHGFHLRTANYLTKLPMFAAGWWKAYRPNWWEIGVYYRSGDGKAAFDKDVKAGKLDHWLNQVLFYTCLENYNKIRSLEGSDGRWYYNELSLDNNKGQVHDPLNKSQPETLASQQLSNFLSNLNDDEAKMYQLWQRILKEAKVTKGYDKRLNYGIYQINDELNTSHKETNSRGKTTTVYDYPQLNGDLNTMRGLIKNYYHKYVMPNLFKYEFIK